MDQENLVIREQRVLVVDDDPVNVEIFRTILDDQCRMFVAGDGPAALAMAERERPDIVLLDVMMPGMSGLEVCRAIRMRDSLRFTKIILVSARGSLEERLEGYRAGADDYLIKPFDWSELLAKIKVFSRLKFMEEMDELKGDFVTVLAHETRTPLTRIIGAVSVLSQLCDRPDAKPFLEMVEVSSQKLRRMLERTLLILSFRAPGSEGPIEVFPIEDALAHTWADRADLALGAFREKTKVAFHRPHLEMALTALRGFAELWQDEVGRSDSNAARSPAVGCSASKETRPPPNWRAARRSSISSRSPTWSTTAASWISIFHWSRRSCNATKDRSICGSSAKDGSESRPNFPARLHSGRLSGRLSGRRRRSSGPRSHPPPSARYPARRS
ncbi:MAG: response regulator [Candidatus Eisenbacteria bacterium]